MRLLLAEPQTAGELTQKLRESKTLGHLADRLDQMGLPKGDPDRLIGRVCATRHLARKFVAEHPEAGIEAAAGRLDLDCAHVEVMSPPFAYEIINAWPKVLFINCNTDVQETLNFVYERRPKLL